jgi:protein involved in polysaccharide export with SLBB domain
VQDHPEISGSATIGPDGDILLPLVNEPVYARDITAPELQKRVVEVLKRYVKDPIVYVGITDYRSKVFYVIDEIGCTPYNITRANFTLRDALFIADWGSNRALGRVLIIKPHMLHPVVKKVDAFDIVYRGNLSKNIRIENGDVIYVPVTAANKISTTIADALSPFKAFRDIRNEWLNWRWNLKNGWYNMFRIPRSAEEEQNAFSSPSTGSISQ